jgi:DNA-binding response OmpR family regulator
MAMSIATAEHTSTMLPRLALIVDPDRDTRELYKTFLVPNRYVIEEASDGREALAKALTDPPDIVVTETRLSGVDGFDLCDLLRRDRETRNVPIVVLTGEIRAAQHDRARVAGADAVLVKPCLPEVLLAKMTDLIRHSAELRGRSRVLQAQAEARLSRAADAIEHSAAARIKLSKTHARYETTSPPQAPVDLVCPNCLTQRLRYERSFIGGVSSKYPEQWDELTCPGKCGDYQYRHRTRKLTRRPS